MSLQAKKLLMSMELSNKNWKLAFTDGTKERRRSIPARGQAALKYEIGYAKQKLGLPADAPVVSCYEAGRDGFWIHRLLTTWGVENRVMDPASIEVNRRHKQRKTDGLDAGKLLRLLVRRELHGEQKAFSVVCVPTEEQEELMRICREREELVTESRRHRTRIKSLCALNGIALEKRGAMRIEGLKKWDQKGLRERWVQEMKREQERLKMVEEQLATVEEAQEQLMKDSPERAMEVARMLNRLKAVGLQSSLLLSVECFSWRVFANRKRLGSFFGLVGTPYDSGESRREQGISKAGSGRLRAAMLELAWMWTRWQPNSALTKWFLERVARGGTSRGKRKAIVALARKLVVALWKYVEQGIVPEGALLRA